MYPLVMKPILKEKVWGGQRLAHFGKSLPAGAKVGESWEVADMSSTSPSGGGGAAARSVIANGELAGTALHELITSAPDALLGHLPLSAEGGFPLLIKYLDARENLSIQVHPSATYAADHPDAHLKSEAWYVLEAEPGALLFKGLRPGVGRAELEAAVEQGTLVELLNSVPAVPGECHDLPSGTIHALGAGVLVAEVQTASDTTFRLYDWAEEHGRTGRPLHISEALEAMLLEPPSPAVRLAEGSRGDMLVSTPFFDLSAFTFSPSERIREVDGRGCRILMVIDGDMTLVSPNDAFDPVSAPLGTTVVIPNEIDKAVELRGGGTFLSIGFGVR